VAKTYLLSGRSGHLVEFNHKLHMNITPASITRSRCGCQAGTEMLHSASDLVT
jgi:hypothetical protein